MAPQVIVRTNPPSRRRRVGEVAGGVAAECAAVCCCCPCAVINIMVLAMYKVPVILYKRAMQKKERHRLLKEMKKKKNDIVFLHPEISCSDVSEFELVAPATEKEKEAEFAEEKIEAVTLEKEMWARFAGTGFWRSESQRQP